MPMNQESKQVRLGDNSFLTHLTDEGMVYQGSSLDREIKIVAVEGRSEDWAAYFETPWTLFHNVADYGNKLPEQVGAELFPDWAKRLKWRL